MSPLLFVLRNYVSCIVKVTSAQVVGTGYTV